MCCFSIGRGIREFTHKVLFQKIHLMNNLLQIENKQQKNVSKLETLNVIGQKLFHLNKITQLDDIHQHKRSSIC